MRASKALEALFLDYVAYYEAKWLQGKLIACNETATTERVKHILTAAPRLFQELGGFTLHSIISTCVLKANDHRMQLKTLISALEFLELVCVNLFLCPWRKEFKSLKTFTGRFVYSVQSVLPEEILKGILQKIGYTTKTSTEFLVTEIINEKENQQFAFQIFLARMECQLILEMTNDAKTSNCIKFLKERADTSVKSEDKYKGKPATVKEHPVNVLNGNMLKTTRRSASGLNSSSINPETRDSKQRVPFEMSKDGMLRAKGMHESETTVNETLARKDKCHFEPCSDGSNKAMHTPFSVEPSKTKTTSISQSTSYGNSNKELHPCNLSESANLDTKVLNVFTLPENKKLDHKGHNFSQSFENLQMNSRLPRLSEITGSQERQGHHPSESDGKENFNSKTLNPLESAEKEKVDIQSLNTPKSSDKTTGNKVLNTFMSTQKSHTYMEELYCSTSAHKTMINKNELIPSEPTEEKKMAKEDYFSFTFNAERNGSSKGKSNSGSAGDKREYHGMFSHLQSSEDRSDSKPIYNPVLPVGMNTSNSDPKSHVPSCASESADRILDSKKEATACFQSNRSESEEFLTQYSDLNIAQKPVIKESPSQYKKLKVSRIADDAAMLEESATAEPQPLRCHENKAQGSESYTEATSKICKPAKELEEIEEAYDDIPGKNFSLSNPSHKPPIAKSSTIKNDTALSFCNVPVGAHEESDEEECELASSFSKLKISEYLEEHLPAQIEKTSSIEAAGFKKRSNINGKQAHVANSTSRLACSPQNNIAERNFSLPNSLTKITECTEGVQLESISKPRVVAGMPLDNYRQIREPPGCTYIPPDSLKNQPFEENFDSSYFKFLPEENVDKHSSTDTVPVGGSVFQMNEDLKEDFIVISHQMAPND